MIAEIPHIMVPAVALMKSPHEQEPNFILFSGNNFFRTVFCLNSFNSFHGFFLNLADIPHLYSSAILISPDLTHSKDSHSYTFPFRTDLCIVLFCERDLLN